MKHLFFALLVLVQLTVVAQTQVTYEKPPVFEECKDQIIDQQKECFRFNFNTRFFKTFKMPENLNSENYSGVLKLLFEVDKEGFFQLIYIDAEYDELKTETQRVFEQLPRVEPATYDGRPTFSQYTTEITVPMDAPVKLDVPSETDIQVAEENTTSKPKKKREKDPNLNAVLSNEIDSINKSLKPFSHREYSSQLNIPFTHNYYAKFDKNMNAIGTNSHTASKPFLYDDVAPYYDFKSEKESLSKDINGLIERKLWNERMVRVEGKDYWFTIDPILDLQVGADSESESGSTYNNTRGVFIQAGIGKRFNFMTSFYESQGRFAKYFNDYAESLKAFGPDPAIIPGRGIAKRFKEDSYDYPVAEAYLSYTPAKFLNVQFGHGRNFIGDGYRSLFQSDVASPSPFLKTNLKFWKIKYTSSWMWLKDVRDEVVQDGAFLTKYMANHYLSWNVSKRLNLGFFESVIWNNANDRGFDVNYLNPLIFLRAVEFETGQDAGNALIGLSAKYKYNNKVNLYGQFILDEFSLSDIRAGEKSWKNKFGYQLGMKYFDAFNVDGLLLQAEYNQVRPYTFSHNTVVLNYGHNNQSMAHLWGANFRELVLIGRYNYKRWFGDAKFIMGTRGVSFNTPEDDFYYGGSIYGNENNRPSDTGIAIGQGNKVSQFQADLQAGYIVNPATNLRLFSNLTLRNFDPTVETTSTQQSNTVWFTIGLRTDLFNWYNDF
ncbi:gliding motility protein RemB [Winogradskyella maritima]|uniref:Gliding motility protein RemB n=1 Tax=Winogradskyella maritima TaxID=1517766 RepID=A0ABV8AGF4_9FLAO|nr:gliding motility protein RemB [Winogradskyella maritima]